MPGRRPDTTSRANAVSAVTTEPARLPRPRAASSTTSAASVADDRAHRAERLHLVRLGPVRVVAPQQQRGDERAPLGVGADHVDLVRVAVDDPARAGQRLDRAAHLLALLQPGQRAHPDAVGRVADRDPGQPGRHRLRHLIASAAGHQGPPDRRALLAGLDRHLRDELPDVQIELGRARRGVGPRSEQLSESASAVNRTRVRRPPGGPASARAVAADPVNADQVLLGEVVEQRRRATPQTSCTAPSRQQSGLDDQLAPAAREVRGRAGRLDQAGHAREERRARTSPAGPTPGS